MPTALEQPAPSFNDVWRMFQETDRKFQETERLLKERAMETDRKFQETERLLKERALETDLKFKETDRKFKEMTASLGSLGNRLGEFVEEMVKPGLVRLFQERDLKVHRTMQNLICKDDAGQLIAQVDLLVVDSDTAIAVECKSHLSIDDVNEHIERMGLFKTCWPEYACYKLLGAVAAMVLPEGVGRYAYRKGLFVLAQNGEIVEVRNDSKFQPTVW